MNYEDRSVCDMISKENPVREPGLAEQLANIDEMASRAMELARAAQMTLAGAEKDLEEPRAPATCMKEAIWIIHSKMNELIRRLECINKTIC